MKHALASGILLSELVQQNCEIMIALLPTK